MTDTVREHAARWKLDDTATHNTPGPTYQSPLDHDRYPIPALLRWRAPWIENLPVTIPKSRYLTHDVAQLEAERFWARVWQVACREEHLRTVGDSVLYEYEVADRQYIVVRSDETTIRCFSNVCLHPRSPAARRRRARRPLALPVPRLQLEPGRLPCAGPDAVGLPPCQSRRRADARGEGRDGGDLCGSTRPGAPPLQDFIADCPRQFKRFPPDDWYTQAQSANLLNCNWKLAVEAFIEASHVYATHPQSITGNDPCNSQYDMWDHFVRIITPIGVPSVMLLASPPSKRSSTP